LGVTDAAQVSAGDQHVCARLRSGAVQCWGQNYFGECGDGSTVNFIAPFTVPGISQAVEVATGRGHTCGRSATRAARCWGDNHHGGLGDGTFPSSVTPVTVVGLP